MKKLKNIGKYSKSKPKKRIVFLGFRRKPKRKSKLIPTLIKEIPEILSPRNTTGYLFEYNSSTFYPKEELDIDLNLDLEFPLVDAHSDLIKMENENLEIKEPPLMLELVSTAAQSQDLRDSKLSFE